MCSLYPSLNRPPSPTERVRGLREAFHLPEMLSSPSQGGIKPSFYPWKRGNTPLPPPQWSLGYWDACLTPGTGFEDWGRSTRWSLSFRRASLSKKIAARPHSGARICRQGHNKVSQKGKSSEILLGWGGVHTTIKHHLIHCNSHVITCICNKEGQFWPFFTSKWNHENNKTTQASLYHSGRLVGMRTQLVWNVKWASRLIKSAEATHAQENASSLRRKRKRSNCRSRRWSC